MNYKGYFDVCSHKAIIKFIETDCFITVKWKYNKKEGEKASLPHHRYNTVVIVFKVVSRANHLVGKD